MGIQKTLVITGASKGIGYATATLFHNNGYRIVNISRSPITLEGAVQINADLSDINWLSGVSDTLLNSVAGSDEIVVIHCAANHKHDTIASLEAHTLQQVLQANLVAPVQLSQCLLPHMKAGSSVIFLGSTLSEKAVANACSYVTSKHAVIGLMRSTCQDLIGKNIHTACVCPGFTDTEMLRVHVGDSQEILKDIASRVSFNRLIQPEEIADTLYFCATNPAINGSVIHANLGQIES